MTADQQKDFNMLKLYREEHLKQLLQLLDEAETIVSTADLPVVAKAISLAKSEYQASDIVLETMCNTFAAIDSENIKLRQERNKLIEENAKLLKALASQMHSAS